MSDQSSQQQTTKQYEFVSLFPLRPVNISLTIETYEKLLNQVTCSLCSGLLTTPVYLKCSHRFCKECIERQIRSNRKKRCPSCKMELLSKRDLRMDDFTFDFVDILFHDLMMDQQQEKQNDLKRQRKAQINSIKGSTSWMRSQYRSMNKQSIDEAIKKEIMDFERERDIHQLAFSSFILSNGAKKRGRPRKQIQQQYQPLPRKLKKRKNKSNETSQQIINQTSRNLNQSSILATSYTSYTSISQSNIKIQNNDLDHLDSNIILPQIQNNPQIKVQSSAISTQLNSVAMKFQEIDKQFKNNYGNKYFKRLNQITNKQISIKIRLIPHPTKPFTPSLPFQFIQLSIRLSLYLLTSLIAQSLNIDSLNIRLYVRSGCQLIQVKLKHQLSQINQKYWKTNDEIDAYDLAELIEFISLVHHHENYYQQNTIRRFLYYSVEYEQQQRPTTSKKR